MSKIHPSAIVEPSVDLAEDVQVGAYVVIKGAVRIGRNTIVREHSLIEGSTQIGANCKIGPGAYLGLEPQHLQFKTDAQNPTFLNVGDNVTIRECSAIHRATKPGLDCATTIGNDSYIMGQTHIAHDCRLGEGVIMANGVLLAGHCTIAANAFLGGGSTLHQFCRVGRLAVISGNEPVSRDIPPFAADRYGGLKGYNAVGCRRAGMSRETIQAIRAVYQRLHSHRTMNKAVAAIRAEIPDLPEVREILAFIAESKRGIQPSLKGRSQYDDDGAN